MKRIECLLVYEAKHKIYTVMQPPGLRSRGLKCHCEELANAVTNVFKGDENLWGISSHNPSG